MKKVIFVAVLGLMCVPAFASTWYWTNYEDDNDFSVLGNWNAAADGSSSTIVTDLNGDTLRIYRAGANKAVLSSTLTDVIGTIQIGNGTNVVGEMQVAGGTNSMSNSLTVGQSGGTGTFSVTGGSFAVPLTFTTFGNGGTAICNFSGGTFTADRITLGQVGGDSGTMNVTGGTVNVVISDLTPTISTGAIRALSGEGFLNISGSGVVNVQTVFLAARLTITMNGGEFNASGYYKPAGYTGDDTPVTKSTFDFNETMIASGLVKGKVEYNAGLFKVAGDQASLLDAVIAAGNIYTTVEGMEVDAQYNETGDFTTLALVIPEPATLAILGLGSLFLVRRK